MRWELIKTIVADAAELPASERAGFAGRACGGDESILREVNRLLENLGDEESSILSTPPATLASGTLLASRFRIDRFLGAGGMGHVYEAFDTGLATRVAIKVLRETEAAAPEFAARFRREARIAQKVSHPNICRIYDAGSHSGRLFLTMELIDGETLSQTIRRRGKLPCEEALPIVRQMAAGLDALHRHGIVHRDFKPGNIMLTSGGERAVIMDFGLARLTGQVSTVTALSESGQVLGTPAYMAPEQLRGLPARSSADIYAFGLTVYELVTGEKAFPASSAIENALGRILTDPAPPKGVPDLWRMLIMQCLEREPEKRPETAGEVAAMLGGDTPAERKWGDLQIQKSAGPDTFIAFDPTRAREVLLRLLPLEAPGEDGGVAVAAEVRQRAVVRHPNLISIHGIAEHDGRTGYWSDRAAGVPLGAYLVSRGSLGTDEAVAIVASVARTAGALHEKGLAHGRIGLQGVYREEGGRIWLSPAGEPGGTVADDVAASAALLFELLTGSRPDADGPSLRDLHPGVPEELDRAIAKAASPDPAARFANGTEFAAELERLSRSNSGNTRKRWRIAAGLAVAMAAGAAGVYYGPLGKPLAAWTGKASGAHARYLEAQDALAHYYRPRGTERAIGLFRQTIEADPKFAMAYAGLARANFLQFWQLKDTAFVEPSLAAATHALSLDPNLAPVHVTLGMLYTQTGKNDLAAQELDSALRLDKFNAEAYYALAELYYRQGRTADVEPSLRKAIDLAPADWRFPHELGFFFMRTGKFDAAIEQCLQAVQLSPDNPRAYANLALTYLRSRRPADAAAAYRKAISIEPNYSRFAGLGAALEQMGDLPGAVAALEEAIRSSPESHLAWGNLANVYWLMPGHEEKAKSALAKAVELGEILRQDRPNDGDLLARIGAYYEMLGKPEKSRPLLRQAAALSASDPQVLFQIALAHETGGRRPEALHNLSASLARGLPLSRITESNYLKGLVKDPAFVKLSQQYPAKPQ